MNDSIKIFIIIVLTMILTHLIVSKGLTRSIEYVNEYMTNIPIAKNKNNIV